jgi:hypothetical protein
MKTLDRTVLVAFALRLLSLLPATAVFSFCLMTQANAQNTQQISGFVKDSSDAVVPSAKVVITQTETGFTRAADITESGYYIVTNIPIGHYDITAECPGFQKLVRTGVTVDVDSRVSLDLTLQVGALTETVVVAASAAQVEASSGEVGRLVTGQQATQLQLNGRNFMQLVNLAPGVSSTVTSGFSLFGSYGSQTTYSNVNGGRSDVLSVNLDGADNLASGGGGLNMVALNPDAIAEFKMMTSNYSAEHGQNAGAVINVAVKSGTKEFHGSVYEFIRNNAFDARAYLAQTKNELRLNDFGYSLGGPIPIPGPKLKDKLFFFSGMEFKRERQGAANTWTVPTVAQRTGDFSSLPASQQPKDPTNGVPFPGAVIPKSRFSSNSSRLVQNYPVPNFSGIGGNYLFPTVTPLASNEYLGKLDYNLNEKNQFTFNCLYEFYYTDQNLTQLVTFHRTSPAWNVSLKWNYIPTASIVNTLQIARPSDVINQNDFKANPLFITDFTRQGQGLSYPMIYGNSPYMPSMSISGYTGLSASPYQFQNSNRILLLRDDFTKILGTHSLKLGIWAEKQRKLQDNPPALNGSFAFQTGWAGSSGNALADGLLGAFYTYTEAANTRDGFFPYSQIEWYVSDNWKVTHRLTLDLGIRFNYMQPQYVSLQNAAMFVPQYFDPSKAPQINQSTGELIPGTGNPVNGLALGGSGWNDFSKSRFPSAWLTNPQYLSLFHGLPLQMTPSHLLPGPRISFAYDLTGRQKTVLRGGFGRTFERLQGNFVFSRINNPPFAPSATIYYGNVDDPAGGTGRVFPGSISNSTRLDLKVPSIQNWSVGVQHKLTDNTLLDITYIGSSGYDLTWNNDVNQLALGTLTKNPGINVNALRPYPGYASIPLLQNGANSIYNSLQVQFRKQFTAGGMLNVSYTWSRVMTDASSYSEQPMDPSNLKGDWSRASFDRNQMLIFNYVYPIPLWQQGNTWYKKLFGGWQLSGVTTIEGGLPINLGISSDIAGVGTASRQRPNLVGDWTINSHTPASWFNTAAFANPAPGTWGTLGKYALRGPGMNNWDLSLYKSEKLKERLSLQIRAEVYNAPNHLSYSSVGTTLGTATFGQVTGAADPRILQFGMKLVF